VGGGCISQASRLEISESREKSFSVFWKRNNADFLDNFEKEADGLRRLAETDQVATPAVLAVGFVGDASHLLTQWVESRPTDGRFFQKWGSALAKHHRETKGTRVGLDCDNYLGASEQRNQCRHEKWIDFVAQQRLIPQLQWAQHAGVAGSKLVRQCQQIIDELPALLEGRDASTSLLHGDLWSGNWMCGELQEIPPLVSADQPVTADIDVPSKQPGSRAPVSEKLSADVPVWIDPAVYYGCREAEFGMLFLFGGCPPDFYEAYQAEWPLPERWRQRVQVYVLYHLLNHLNLFGSGYRGSCESTAEGLLQSL